MELMAVSSLVSPARRPLAEKRAKLVESIAFILTVDLRNREIILNHMPRSFLMLRFHWSIHNLLEFLFP